MYRHGLNISEKEVAGFCRRHHIRKLSLFGSILGNGFRSESDVDILVDFDSGHIPGFALIRMQDELSKLFGGRSIDLVTAKFLNHRIRDRVLNTAQVLYERK